MKLRVLFLVGVFAMLAGQGLPSQGQANPSLLRLPIQPLTPSKRGVVFKAADAKGFGKQCSRESPVGWWSSVPPSKAEIRALEAALPQWIKTHQSWREKASFETFQYQYGALVRGKKRLIYVSAAIPDNSNKQQYWRRIPTFVCDGGSSFWGIEYDVAANKFQNASFNGPG